MVVINLSSDTPDEVQLVPLNHEVRIVAFEVSSHARTSRWLAHVQDTLTIQWKIRPH